MKRGFLALMGLAIVTSVVISVMLALPITRWRTGEGKIEPLNLAPAGTHAVTSRRIWIDTDAACGAGRTSDPDDCLALLALLKAPRIAVVGISTVFGNAPLTVTDRTTRDLTTRLAAEGFAVSPVYRGRDSATIRNDDSPSPAERAMHDALSEAPIVIIALGPLTNVAAVLRAHPNLSQRVQRIVAVMGQRPGHVFHPVEGGRAAILFGHGPIFKDFNFALDQAAAAELLSLGIPITLIPYEAARKIAVVERDLDAMRHTGGTARWVAERSAEWLSFWREDIRQRGFFPFDLVAATYLLHPELFRCAEVRASVRPHSWFRRWLLGDVGLFVDQRPGGGKDEPQHHVVYCPSPSPGLNDAALIAMTRKRPTSSPR